MEPVLSLAEAIADENTRAREMIVEFDSPFGRKIKTDCKPYKVFRNKT